MQIDSRSCLAIGDPCIDVIADASDNVLGKFCEKTGGSTLVDSEQQELILQILKKNGEDDADGTHELAQVAGGSAANVLVCVARLAPGLRCQYDPRKTVQHVNSNVITTMSKIR